MKKHNSKVLPLLVSCVFLISVFHMPLSAQMYDVADGGSFSSVPVPATPADGDTINLQGATALGDVSITLPSGAAAGSADLTINAPATGSTVTVGSGITLFGNDSAINASYTVDLTGGDIAFTGADTGVFAITGTGTNNLTINVKDGVLFLTNNNLQYGAVYVADSSGTLTGVGAVTGDIVINGVLNASGNTAAKYGSVITAGIDYKTNDAGGNVTVGIEGEDSVMSDNSSATNSGAIYAAGNVMLKGNWTINGNKALSSGGAIYSRGDITVTGSLEANNNTGNSAGGAFYADAFTAGKEGLASSLSGNTVTKTGSQDASWGGGIYALKDVTLFGNWIIDGNSAELWGGAICSKGDINITGNSTITNNNAGEYGGAIMAFVSDAASNVTIGSAGTTTEISGNSAQYGGAIFATDVTLNGSQTIENNTASGYGGAIYNTGNVNITGDSDITGNEAQYGGAIMANGTTSSVTIGGAGTTNTLSNNKATAGDGGGIYSISDVTLNGSQTIDNNSSTEYGGAVYSKGNVNITGDSVITNNTSGYGGAIMGLGTTSSITIGGAGTTTTISNNTASAGGAGAVYSNVDAAINGSNITITGNTASSYAGAIYGKSAVTIGDNASTVYIDNNKAGFILGTSTNTTSVGGAIRSGGTTDISGASVTLSNNTATSSGGGVYSAGDMTVNGMFTAENNASQNGYGGAIWAGTDLTLNATGGNFIFSGNTDSAGANAIWLSNTGGAATATLNAASGDIIFYDPIANNAANGRVIVNKTGAGMVSFDGENLGAGNTSLIYGNTTVQAGTFEISNNAVYGALASDVTQTDPASFTALAGTTVQGGGYGTLRADNIVLDGATLNIAGRQAFAASGKYSTFVIDPSTLSMNGTNIIFNTYLGDDSSPSDLLILDGGTDGLTATGQAKITVNNTGGAGAQTTADGIKLVEVQNGATTADDTFTLANRVAAGAYEYDLFKNGVGADASDGNWYLRSIYKDTPQPPVPPQTLAIRPEVPAYLANMRAVSDLFMMNLHDRLGEPQYMESVRMPNTNTADCRNCGENCSCEACAGNYLPSAWARIQGRYSSYDEMNGNFDAEQTKYLLNGGVDLTAWASSGNDRWILGIMGAYGHAGTKVKSKDVPETNSGISREAKADVDGTSAGAYLTWHNSAKDQRGLYADIWALHGWFDNKVSGNAMAEESYKSQNTQVSAEVGYAFRVLHKDNGRQLFLEPQAQFVYNFMNQDSHTETGGIIPTAVNNADGSGWVSRLGGRIYTNVEGSAHRFQPFVELNWLHSDSKNSLDFNGVSMSDDLDNDTFEAKIGASGMIADRWQLWGWIGAGTANNAGYSVGGNVGIRYSFGGPKSNCGCAKEPQKESVERAEPEQFVEQPQPDPLEAQRLAEEQAKLEAQRKAEEEKAAQARRIAEEAAVTQEISDADLAKQKAEAEARRKRQMLKTYTLTTHFKTNSYFLSEEDKEQINEIAGELGRYDYKKISIEGHTDNTGLKETNKRLSRQRARSVYDEFIKVGILAKKMTYEGFADTMPVQSNSTAEGRAANRRVEVFVE